MGNAASGQQAAMRVRVRGAGWAGRQPAGRRGRAGRARLVVRHADGPLVRMPPLVLAERVPSGRESGMQPKELCVSGRLGCGLHATAFQQLRRPSHAGPPLFAGTRGQATRVSGRRRGNVTCCSGIGRGARRRKETAWP